MTRKTYRTAQGKTVDLGALMLQNENIRAVGNMKVNARGDLVDGWNRPIDNRTQHVKKHYDKQVTNVQDDPVVSSAATTAAKSRPVKTQPKTEIAPGADITTQTVDIDPLSAETVPQQTGGLAAAIAKARQIRQEPIKSNQQLAKTQPGVSRI